MRAELPGCFQKLNARRRSRPSGVCMTGRCVRLWQASAVSAAITAGVIICVYFFRHIAPFGGRSILTIDCFHQYAPFLLEVRHRILAGKSLLYSWEAGLGRDLFVQNAYYTASPLDYLVLMIKPEQICAFMALLICLKMSLCAASFCLYLNLSHQRGNAYSVLFGVLYSFCGFIACFYWNYMWLDVAAVFPILIWSMESMLSRHTAAARIRYCIVLAALMILNFYLAFIVCVFLIPYFFKYMLSSKHTRAQWMTAGLEFAGFSVMAAAAAAFLLLPAVLAISRTRGGNSEQPRFTFYLSIFQLVAAHFTGARPSVMSRNQDAPNIYSGVVTLLLIPVYIRFAPAGRREKACTLGYAAFLLLCCVLEPLDYLAHGLYFPANMPHRYSFIYSFVLLNMAYEAFPRLKEAGKRMLLLSASILGAVLVVTDRFITPALADYEPVLSDRELAGNLILLFAYAALFSFCAAGERGQHIRRHIYRIAAALVLVECGYMFSNSIEITTDEKEYTAHMEDTREAMAAEDEDSGGRLLRSEYARTEAINEGSIYHFNGFSTFSSMVPGSLTEMMKSLGVASGAKTFRYYDATPLVNYLFDIGYVYSTDIMGVSSHMHALGSYKTIRLWRNDDEPALGYMVSPAVLEWEAREGDPFETQNSFASAAAGTGDGMFSSIAAARVNLDHGSFLSTDGIGGFQYLLDDPYDLDSVPLVTAVYESPRDGDLYMYIDSEQSQKVTYYTSGEIQNRELGTGNETVHIGNVAEGERITVTFALDKKGDFDTHYAQTGSVKILMAFYDDSEFRKVKTVLDNCRWMPDLTGDTCLSGKVNAVKQGILLTSVPYSEGWEINTDGEPAEAVTVGGALIGVKLDAGEHTVTMRYHTPGLKTGIIISLAAAVFLVLYGVLARMHSNRRSCMK